MNGFETTLDVLGEEEFIRGIVGRSLSEFRFDSLYTLYRMSHYSNLTLIEMPYVYTVGAYCANSCPKLTSVYLPMVQFIGSNAFANCEALESVTLGNDLSTISSYAFVNTGIKNIDFMPERSMSWGTNVFQSCKSLNSVYWKSSWGTPPVYTFSGCENLESFEAPEASSIYQILNSCYALSHVSIPKCRQLFDAFMYCSSLTEIRLPAVSYIGMSAFTYCSKLSTVYIGQDLCSLVASNAFYSTKITFATGSIYVPASRVDYYRNSTNWNWFSTQIKGYDYENDRPVD